MVKVKEKPKALGAKKEMKESMNKMDDQYAQAGHKKEKAERMKSKAGEGYMLRSATKNIMKGNEHEEKHYAAKRRLPKKK